MSNVFFFFPSLSFCLLVTNVVSRWLSRLRCSPERMFIKIHNCRGPPTAAQASVYVSRSFFILAVNTELLQSVVHMPAGARVWASTDVRGRACVRPCQEEGKQRPPNCRCSVPPVLLAILAPRLTADFLPNRLSALAWGTEHLLTLCLLPACSLTEVHCVTFKDKAWSSPFDLWILVWREIVTIYTSLTLLWLLCLCAFVCL